MTGVARCVVVVGSGGVGKTTVAAALATAASRSGRRTVVVTVDPARRLAQSIGLEGAVGNEVIEVGGGLWATMLDAEAGWDDLVRCHARDAPTAERIISNPLYRNVTSRFVHSLNYLAMDRLGQLVDDPRFDLVVVDTPPSHNTLDFLDSPERMEEFFSGRLLRWITAPARSTVASLTSRPFLAVADRVLGARFIADIMEFFALLAGIEPGLRRRAAEISALLRSDTTRFLLVTVPEHAPASETAALGDALSRRAMAPWLCMANRCVSAPVCESDNPEPELQAALEAVGEPAAARLAAPLARVVRHDRAVAAAHRVVLADLRRTVPVVMLAEMGASGAPEIVDELAGEITRALSPPSSHAGGVLGGAVSSGQTGADHGNNL